MKHELKIKDNYLKRLIDGKKTAEVRFNDRDYQLGDKLQFYNTKNKGVGDPMFWIEFKITHIHSGLGLEKGYVCLSLKPA